uniref:Uncharacterized protein n=1 Tax=Anguilla anguilla TaxID=7936 RepID=A0A0E9TRT5_ANGAN
MTRLERIIQNISLQRHQSC